MLRHAHDVGVGSAICEKLLDRVAQFAVSSQSAELAFEISEAKDLCGPIIQSALRVADKGGNGGCDSCDRMDAAGNFFDIDAGISS